MDHIVELQLVAAALNRLPFQYHGIDLGILVDFFNGDGNLRELQSAENRAKGAAVRRLIAGIQSVQGDHARIQPIRQHWHRQLKGKIPVEFCLFKDKLNSILRRHVLL